MRKTTPVKLSCLKPHQVFVFGSNESGFHGAGAAGLAFRGDSRNTWRSDEFFLKAMASPPGAEARIGLWAVYGVFSGFQEGREGKSYAIKTIRRPGFRRSTPLSEILDQMASLCLYAAERPELEFLVAKFGCGLAGYTVTEISGLWETMLREGCLPDNIVLPIEFEKRT